MTGHGTAQRHLGTGGDTAVVCTVEHRLPLAVLLADFDYRAAMGGHFDIHLFLRERGLFHLAIDDLDKAGEHQVRIGIFVVDHEDAMFRRPLDGDIADIIIVVAELARLRFGRLSGRVEFWRIGEKLVAPAQKHISIIAFRDMMIGIHTGFDLLEGKGRTGCSARITRTQQGERTYGCRNGRDSERSTQKPRREKRRLMISPMVGLSDGLRGSASASSNWLVLNRLCWEKIL